MKNSTDLNKNNELGDEIDIKALFKRILINKHIISAFTASFAIIALIYSLTLSNIYQSTALLSPVDDVGKFTIEAGERFAGDVRLVGDWNLSVPVTRAGRVSLEAPAVWR